MKSLPRAYLVQLPFPSIAEPHPGVAAYYRDYSRVFTAKLEGYFVPEGGLWELPLWVAHISGMLEHLGYEPHLLDLTGRPVDAEACSTVLLEATSRGELLLISPLAQNFDLARQVSRRLMASGRATILGGNMACLAELHDATTIHRGQATPASLAACLEGGVPLVSNRLAPGAPVTWRPSYKLLKTYCGKVPLLRLNASHGCLFDCDFCGDAWSRSLTLVPLEALEYEVCQFEQLFPETHLIYLGDKTFGQAPEAVSNLVRVFAGRPNYQFIVQTHVLAIKDHIIDDMRRLGVVAVELGFESASGELLRANRKTNRSVEVVETAICRLNAAGFRVVLNVLSGLPEETPDAHAGTVEFIRSAGPEVWLYNLYNFVPYPLTRQFHRIRDRIVDWEFRNWREDGPPVFDPWHVTRAESYGFFLEKVAAAHVAIRRQTSNDGLDGPLELGALVRADQ